MDKDQEQPPIAQFSDDEISVEELDTVAGGADSAPINGSMCFCGTNPDSSASPVT